MLHESPTVQDIFRSIPGLTSWGDQEVGNAMETPGSHASTQQHVITGWIAFPISFCQKREGLNIACWSICDRDLDFWSERSVFDHLIVPFWNSWFWVGFAVQRSPWSIDQPSKRALITWFNFDPGYKLFNTRHIGDYPLGGHGFGSDSNRSASLVIDRDQTFSLWNNWDQNSWMVRITWYAMF